MVFHSLLVILVPVVRRMYGNSMPFIRFHPQIAPGAGRIYWVKGWSTVAGVKRSATIWSPNFLLI